MVSLGVIGVVPIANCQLNKVMKVFYSWKYSEK